jgi:hypothetical protein
LIDRAGQWFLQSGILEPGGGVARYYRSDLRANAPVSTEITGYAVSALLFLEQRTGNPAYLEAALRAARFLAHTAWDARLRAFPFEPTNGTARPAFAYFFDCGIIARGLLAAWRASATSEFRDTAIAAGRAMLTDFPEPGAAPRVIHPILALPAKQPLAWGPRWSARPGCYQLKSALAWQELFEVSGENTFRNAYESALATALETHADFLPGAADPHEVMDRLHAYCYFLEGLLPVVDRPDCAEAFRDGVERVSRFLRELAPSFARSDVYAQLLRVRLFGEASGVLPLDVAAAAEEAEAAAGFQLRDCDTAGLAHAGGFVFGRKQGQDMPFINPVSTAFCAQALALWNDRQCGRALASIQTLI